jgi:enolase
MSPARSSTTSNGTYTFKKSSGKTLSGEQLVEFYVKLCNNYPIVSYRGRLRRGRLGQTWKLLTEQAGFQGPAGRRRSVRDQREVPAAKGIDTATANSRFW